MEKFAGLQYSIVLSKPTVSQDSSRYFSSTWSVFQNGWAFPCSCLNIWERCPSIRIARKRSWGKKPNHLIIARKYLVHEEKTNLLFKPSAFTAKSGEHTHATRNLLVIYYQSLRINCSRCAFFCMFFGENPFLASNANLFETLHPLQSPSIHHGFILNQNFISVQNAS